MTVLGSTSFATRAASTAGLKSQLIIVMQTMPGRQSASRFRYSSQPDRRRRSISSVSWPPGPAPIDWANSPLWRQAARLISPMAMPRAVDAVAVRIESNVGYAWKDQRDLHGSARPMETRAPLPCLPFLPKRAAATRDRGAGSQRAPLPVCRDYKASRPHDLERFTAADRRTAKSGDWSIFRLEDAEYQENRGPKTWTCPLRL